MDDSINSVFNEDQGIKLHRQLAELLTKTGMQARKRLSNSSKTLRDIPLQDRKAKVDLYTKYKDIWSIVVSVPICSVKGLSSESKVYT